MKATHILTTNNIKYNVTAAPREVGRKWYCESFLREAVEGKSSF